MLFCLRETLWIPFLPRSIKHGTADPHKRAGAAFTHEEEGKSDGERIRKKRRRKRRMPERDCCILT